MTRVAEPSAGAAPVGSWMARVEFAGARRRCAAARGRGFLLILPIRAPPAVGSW